ncbi:MAG: 50S ribosomal protein L11 methyltransferase, partial [Clostridia bacterium]|nr:50S ribosomal protein L11 methyltransferase [Clostridia bacterium]
RSAVWRIRSYSGGIMQWQQLTVSTTSEAADAVSDIMIQAGASGTVIQDKSEVAALRDSKGPNGWDMIDDELVDEMPENVLVTGYYSTDGAEAAVSYMRKAFEGLTDAGELTIETREVDDKDWAEGWKEQFSPIRLGNTFVVTPSWCSVEEKTGDRIIKIDPGMAFGTGAHETTAMCVEMVERYVKSGNTMIDIGTGSAILAIAASMVGAKSVLAIDIDPLAVKTARDNVTFNGIENVRVVKGDLLKNIDEKANVITANIIADVIIKIAAPVKKHVLPGGYFICSGIPFARSNAVIAALEKAGYLIQELKHMGEWVAICARNINA